jgi:hypothetical protein
VIQLLSFTVWPNPFSVTQIGKLNENSFNALYMSDRVSIKNTGALSQLLLTLVVISFVP